MSHRFLAPLGALVAVIAVMSQAPAPASGQSPGSSPAPRTSWGDPDLQGTWTNTTTTPLQRPADLQGKEFLTEEEWAERNPASGGTPMDLTPSMPTGAYNAFWFEQGELSRRTSLIVDPLDLNQVRFYVNKAEKPVVQIVRQESRTPNERLFR